MNNKGFTLIEVLGALLLTAIVMGVLYEILGSVLQTQEIVEQSFYSKDIGPAVVDQITRDLDNIYAPDDNRPYFLCKTGRNLGLSSTRIDFITTGLSVVREPEKISYYPINEVSYITEPNQKEPDVMILYRREDSFIDDEPLKGGTLYEVYDRVTMFSVEFYDGKVWKETWDNTKDGGLPYAIRFDMRFRSAAEGGEYLEYERKFVKVLGTVPPQKK